MISWFQTAWFKCTNTKTHALTTTTDMPVATSNMGPHIIALPKPIVASVNPEFGNPEARQPR